MLDAEGRLVFPNAHYYVRRREWDYWMAADPSAVGAEALRGHLEQLIATARKALHAIAGRVTLVQGDEEVAPGIRLESTPGHTPGHVMVTISTGGQTIYNISDLVVHPLFIEHPEWAAAIDMDAQQADGARRRFCACRPGECAYIRPPPGAGSQSRTDRETRRRVAVAAGWAGVEEAGRSRYDNH